jgi:hypothetical protein
MFREEQGIVCKALEFQRKWMPGTNKSAKAGGNFKKIPCYFPVLRESDKRPSSSLAQQAP